MEEKTLAQAPSAMIEAALSKNDVDLDKLAKLLELQERWEANEAKKAYVRAMADFKRNPPEILKTEKVEYTRKDGRITKYNHAALDRVSDAINRGLSEYGFYARWEMIQPDINSVEVTCIITHEMGHSETFTMKAPPDNSDGKNPIQAISSTNTYLERITLLGITGLAAKGMDDDGTGGYEDVEYINEEQASQLKKERALRKVDGKMFLEHFEIKSIEQLPAKRFTEALTLIKARPIPKKETPTGEGL